MKIDLKPEEVKKYHDGNGRLGLVRQAHENGEDRLGQF